MRILFINPQGNFNKGLTYLGQHPDFGGQLVYVMELAKAIVRLGHKADILTRQIVDDSWQGLSKNVETFMDGSLRIIRIPFGGTNFLRKEDLWCHIHEFVRGINSFYSASNESYDFITSHYADGGISSALLSNMTGIPYSFTAHSLGAQKLKTLNVNQENFSVMNTTYNLTTRIIAERFSIKNSLFNVTSTNQERYEQYGHKLYSDIADVHNDNKFYVIPPGVNTDLFNINKCSLEDKITSEINAFINRDIVASRRQLPFVIISSRLDFKKNHTGFIHSYFMNKELQEKANLMIQLQGIDNAFDDYSYVRGEPKRVLDTILSDVSKYKLNGKVCLVNLKTQNYLPVCYRLLSRSKSVFCLPAFHEPFGIGPIESMACGLPVAVTNVGGPVEVLTEKSESFGALIDPHSHFDMSSKVLEMIKDKNLWSYYHKQGIKRVTQKYTWDMAAKTQLKIISNKLNSNNLSNQEEKSIPRCFYSGDINNNLLAEDLDPLYFLN